MTVPLALGVAAYAWATQPHSRPRSVDVQTVGEPSSDTTLSAADMYDRLREGAQYQGLAKAIGTVTIVAAKYKLRAGQIDGLRRRMAEGWTGDASDAALQYSRAFIDAMRDTGELLGETAGPSGPFARQVDAYQAVLRDVEKLPATPPESGLLNTVNPFETDTDREINAYNDKATKNVAAYTSYYAASGDNGFALPQQFPTPVSTTVPSVYVPPRHDQSATVQNFSTPVPDAAGGSPGSAQVPPAAVPGGRSAGERTGPGFDTPAGGGSTTGQSFSPAAGTPAVPAAFAGTPQPSAGGTGAPFGMVPGVAGGGAGGAGAGRPGAGPGRPGTSGGGPGAGTRGPGGMAEQAGRRGAPGVAGASAAERAGVSGTRAAGGGPGPGAGRQRKDGEEDKERSTKYVLSEDLDLGLPIVAPPVIGDNR
jgi:hypothetical protein